MGTGVSLREDENVLKLDSGGSCTILQIYQKHCIGHFIWVNCTECKLYFSKAVFFLNSSHLLLMKTM